MISVLRVHVQKGLQEVVSIICSSDISSGVIRGCITVRESYSVKLHQISIERGSKGVQTYPEGDSKKITFATRFQLFGFNESDFPSGLGLNGPNSFVEWLEMKLCKLSYGHQTA
jgi:hypothetical protein